MAATSTGARRGRPRDPEIEDRVYDAAAELYSKAGWSGFRIDAVARQCGVGKDAIYRRWPNRVALLAQVLTARSLYFEDIDTGDTRADLEAMADLYIAHLTGPYGNMLHQVLVDRLHHAEVREASDDYYRVLVQAGRRIGRRAVRRGDVPDSAAATLMIDLVIGGIQNHIVTTPRELRPRMRSRLPQFRTALVQAALAGVGARL
ncbi:MULTISPECIES: TetR/AcrR family transcriptional regulator [Mycolicibacterium]|jgi:AcrR family transcriptional regulator|uniref:TetR family transcriptional regulator n=2 Tax=Mycolicibacterium TaxID=1866885 RepID=A0A378TNB0_9MYCO|nr:MULTISPECIES: TetR/AcrR family transcriptional regulator [Mycolicibacterium]MCV7185318.1 TetR/AcrR family transcriptional regulator [Mycolicibacterium murale]STZ61116.1 TetR family transcriptional regulator [Mycolicibacterium tokaiense]